MCRVFLLRGLFSSCGEQGLLSSGGGVGFSPRWLLSGSTGSGAHRPQYCGSRAREPRPSGCDAWAQLLCHVRSSQIRGGTHVPCFGRKALRRILGSSFPRSYLLREAWEPGVLSHSAGSAIKSPGASSKRLPPPSVVSDSLPARLLCP